MVNDKIEVCLSSMVHLWLELVYLLRVYPYACAWPSHTHASLRSTHSPSVDCLYASHVQIVSEGVATLLKMWEWGHTHRETEPGPLLSHIPVEGILSSLTLLTNNASLYWQMGFEKAPNCLKCLSVCENAWVCGVFICVCFCKGGGVVTCISCYTDMH